MLAGLANGSWGGDYAGGTFDFAAVKLDASGDEVWKWQVCCILSGRHGITEGTSTQRFYVLFFEKCLSLIHI